MYISAFLQKLFNARDKEGENSLVNGAGKKLESELRKRAEALEKDVASLKEISRSKDDFIRITSHEIRTPLDAMRGNIYMVLQGETGDISQKTKDYLDDVLLGGSPVAACK